MLFNKSQVLSRLDHIKRNVFLYKNTFKYCDRHLNRNYKIEIFRPSIFNLQNHGKFSLIYLMWYFFTKGGYKIIYVLDNKKIIHYTHVIPKFWKFKIMGKNDLELGPCWTDGGYRGQGIFPYVIQYVVCTYKNDHNSFYMMVDSNNIASINGIEKSGFVKVSNVVKSKAMGVYTPIIYGNKGDK